MMFDGLQLCIEWAQSTREILWAVEVAEEFFPRLHREGPHHGVVVQNDKHPGRAIYIYRGKKNLVVEIRRAA